jgi:GNAT superfamily N-acetyltransferase
MVIRPATRADLLRLIVLFQQAIAYQRQLMPLFDLVRHVDWLCFVEAKLQHPREWVVVAEWSGEVMGYVAVRIPFPSWHGLLKRALRRLVASPHAHSIVRPKCVGWIEDCYVEPQARRRGTGSALVQAALVWLRAQHVTRVELAVLVANREGLAFWEQQGFGAVRVLLSREIK